MRSPQSAAASNGRASITRLTARTRLITIAFIGINLLSVRLLTDSYPLNRSQAQDSRLPQPALGTPEHGKQVRRGPLRGRGSGAQGRGISENGDLVLPAI